MIERTCKVFCDGCGNQDLCCSDGVKNDDTSSNVPMVMLCDRNFQLFSSYPQQYSDYDIYLHFCPECAKKIGKLIEVLVLARDPLGNLVRDGVNAHKIIDRVKTIEQWIEEDNRTMDRRGQ